MKSYSHDGRAIGELVTFGGGPRELRGVVASAGLDEQSIAVADPTQVRVFDIAADTLVAGRTFQIGAGIQGMCSLGTGVFVRTWRRSTNEIVARVGAEPGDTLYFGAGAESADENTRNQLSRGHIACSPAANIVAVAFDREPFIVAYAPTGELVWRARIEPFTRSDMAVGSGSGSRPTPVDRGRLHDGIAGFISLPPDAFLVNVARVQTTPSGDRPTYGMSTYIIDAATGEGMMLDGAGQYIRAASADRYWSVQTHPEGFEQIVSHRFVQE